MKTSILAKIALLIVLSTSASAFAADPAFMCSGFLKTRDGSKYTEINKNVVFAVTEGYTSITLASIPSHDVVMTGDSDGSVKVFMRQMIEGWPSLRFTQSYSQKETSVTLPHADGDVELDLRCARVR